MGGWLVWGRPVEPVYYSQMWCQLFFGLCALIFRVIYLCLTFVVVVVLHVCISLGICVCVCVCFCEQLLHWRAAHTIATLVR